MKYLDKKPMFFDLGRKDPTDHWPWDEPKAPSAGYYTTAPASLPGGPPPCEHPRKDVIERSYSHNFEIDVMCRGCGKTWKFTKADYLLNNGHRPRLT